MVLRIGMIGGGTVGGGVYEIIMNTNNESFKDVVISKICVRDIKKARDFEIDSSKTTLTTRIEDIVESEDIDCIVEVMGGVGLAKTVVLDGIKAKKSIVTANKALIAEFMSEIETALSSSSGEAKFGYEASVCGGIPIIHLLQSCFAGDKIQEVMGICNGTTNFMLGKMEAGADYNEVLKEAQDLGFAEADPSADVEGYDVRSKLSILAKLAFGTTASNPALGIPCEGITKIKTVDFKFAQEASCTIKLIGTAKLTEKKLSIYVTPKLIPLSHPLSSAKEAGNMVCVSSANLDISSFAGKGAGRYPTANSVVSDIYRIANNLCPDKPFPTIPQDGLSFDNDYVASFYIRCPCETEVDKTNCTFSLKSKTEMDGFVILLTEECVVSKVESFCKETNAFFMPFL